MRKRTSVSRLLIVFGPVAWVLAFAFVCVFAAASRSSAQSANCISVRVLDSKKGKRLKSVSVTMRPSWSWNSNTMTWWWNSNTKTVKTDSTGVARFCLTDPISNDLKLSFGAKFSSCSGDAFKIATILDSGYLARDTQCGSRTFKVTENPKPGELVILVRHVGWLERNIDWP
jgi:hypothetical protein